MERKVYDVCFDFNKKIEDTKLQFDTEISELSKQFRDNVINPFCEKYNLKFESGIGHYYFTHSDGELITEDDVEQILYDLDRDLDGNPIGAKLTHRGYEGLQDIYGVLNTKIYDSHFGFWF